MKKDTILHRIAERMERNWSNIFSQRGKKFSPKGYFLRSLMLLLMMMTVGVGDVWADDVPFEVTTNPSAPHYYLLQNVGTSSFYAMPYDAINDDGLGITTTNVPNSDMRFYFMSVENDDGYYYIIHCSGKYLYAKGSANDDGGARLKESSTLPTDDRYKFCIEKNGGGYYIKNKYIEGNTDSSKLPAPLCKRGGNTGIGPDGNNTKKNLLKWNTYRPIDDYFRWNFIPIGDTNSITWTAPFTPSTEDNYHYYKIKNSVNTSFYISGNTSTNVNTSSTAGSDDEITWIFEKVPAGENGSDEYITYYYIIHAFTGEYMCFDGEPSNYAQNQENALILQPKTETNEQKCQFIVTRSSQRNVMTHYNIIPKVLKDYYWDKQCVGQKDNTDRTNVWTATDRDGDTNTARWVFEQATGYPTPCADPVISCNEDGVVSMTCTEDGAAIHYTVADGLTIPDDPTGADALSTTYSNPITSTKTIKAIAVKGPHVSSVVTQTIVYIPNQTFESSTYDGTDKTPVVKVGETTISSDEYTVTYEKAGVAVTEHKDAGTYTVTITDKADGDYIVYGAGSFTIGQKPLTVKANDNAITYGDAPDHNGVTYDSFAGTEDETVLGGTLAYAYDYTQYGNVGSYTITPSGLTATNYNITFVPGTLTVNPKEIGLTWSTPTSFDYDGAAHALTANASGILNGDEIGVTVTTTAKEGSSLTEGKAINAGSYTATASALTGDKAGNYTPPAVNTQDFTIAKATLTASVTLASWTYGETAATPSVTGNTENGAVTYAYKVKDADDATYSDVQPSDAGTYTVKASIAATTNYTAASATTDFTISKASLSATVSLDGWTYGETAKSPSVTGNTGNGAVTYSYKVKDAADEFTATVPTNAGTYTVKASIATTTNYLASEATADFTIARKSIGDGHVPADGFEIIIDNNTVTITGLTEGTDFTATEDGDGVWTIEGIGNYTGSAQVTHLNLDFYETGETPTDPDANENVKDVAPYQAPMNMAITGKSIYILTGVNQAENAVTLLKIDYAPVGVPVLLLDDLTGTPNSEGSINNSVTVSSFQPTTEADVSANILKRVTNDEGETVGFGKVYMFYKGRFVLTTAGTLPKGTYYFENPNSPSASGARLRIVIGNTTDIDNAQFIMHNSQLDEVWYTTDGRRLSSKPTKKGLYIRHSAENNNSGVIVIK